MADTRKVIITCAVTGSIHTPTMTPYIPITPDDIAAGAIGAAEAGAAILHLHARDPNDGRPTPDPKVFMQFLPLEDLSLEIATPAEARKMLALKGGANVAF